MKTVTFLKKLLPLILTLLAGLMLGACQKYDFPDPGTLPKGLMGSWIETNTMSDTIVFNKNNDTGFFLLKKGFGIINGYRLPLKGSGPYFYIIYPNSINLVNGYSSSFDSKTYYFNFNEPELTIQIGKFSEFDTKKSILTFRKIY
jgi:hypothetical protein